MADRKKKGEVTPPPAQEPAQNLKATIVSLGCTPAWEFEQRLQRGGFFVVGYAGLGVLLILVEYYEAERDQITDRELYLPMAAVQNEAVMARVREAVG